MRLDDAILGHPRTGSSPTVKEFSRVVTRALPHGRATAPRATAQQAHGSYGTGIFARSASIAWSFAALS